MKRRNTIIALSALALVLGCGYGAAQAGSITAAGNNRYAVEDISNSTVVTLADIVYDMGVGRNLDQDFVVIYTLSEGNFATTPAIPVVSGSGAAAVALRRGGSGFDYVVYEFRVTTAMTDAAIITLTAPTVAGGGLHIRGAQVAMQMELKDFGESAYIDQSGGVSSVRALAVSSSDFWIATPGTYGVLTDTATTINAVSTTIAPLTSFVDDGDDDVYRAAATVQILNAHPQAARNALNTENYVLVAEDVATITVTDENGFLGLALNGLYYDLNDDGDADTGEIFNVTGNSATLILAGDDIDGAEHTLYYALPNNNTTQLGISRSLGISGNMNPGSTGVLDYAFTANAAFWQWDSNGTVLQAPLAQIPAGYLSRFVLAAKNNTAPLTWAVVLTGENGNVVNPGAVTSGTIPVNGTVVIDANTVFSGSVYPRCTATFTINGPRNVVQGLYQITNATTGSVSNYIMVEPGTN